MSCDRVRLSGVDAAVCRNHIRADVEASHTPDDECRRLLPSSIAPLAEEVKLELHRKRRFLHAGASARGVGAVSFIQGGPKQSRQPGLMRTHLDAWCAHFDARGRCQATQGKFRRACGRIDSGEVGRLSVRF